MSKPKNYKYKSTDKKTYDTLFSDAKNLKNISPDSDPIFSSWVVEKKSKTLYKVNVLESIDGDIFYYIYHQKHFKNTDSHFHIVKAENPDEMLKYIYSTDEINIDLSNKVFDNTPFRFNYLLPKSHEENIRYPEHGHNCKKVKISDLSKMRCEACNVLYDPVVFAKIKYINYLADRYFVLDSKNQLSILNETDTYLSKYLDLTLGNFQTSKAFNLNLLLNPKSKLYADLNAIHKKFEKKSTLDNPFNNNFHNIYLLNFPEERAETLLDLHLNSSSTYEFETLLNNFSKKYNKLPNPNTHYIQYEELCEEFTNEINLLTAMKFEDSNQDTSIYFEEDMYDESVEYTTEVQVDELLYDIFEPA